MIASCEGGIVMMSIFRPKLDLLFSGLGNSSFFLLLFSLIDGSFMCKIWGLLNGLGLWEAFMMDDGICLFCISERAGFMTGWGSVGGWYNEIPFSSCWKQISLVSLMLW